MVDGIYYWKPNEAEVQKIIYQFIQTGLHADRQGG